MHTQFTSRLCAVLAASAFFTPAVIANSQASPVAYVYVSHIEANQPDSPNVITAYAADNSGRLTPIAGSPFKADVAAMAVNGKFLFGTGTDGATIYSFRMGTNGSLTQVDSIDATKYTPGDCDQPLAVTLDHTGSSLYAFSAFYGTGGGCTANDAVFESFAINKTSGALTFLGHTNGSQSYGYPLTLTAGNLYAYEASAGVLYGFKRESNGNLVYYDTTTHLPTPAAGRQYNPQDAVADPTNHVAVLLQTLSTTSPATYPTRIAVYTMSSTGTLSTSSTASNMGTTAIGIPMFSRMAPSGKLLAVSGDQGLQVFHFNGSNQATHYTPLLVNQQVDQMFWDNANHLYAISRLYNKLYVFTVTPTGYSQAPGSPYTINGPGHLIVQPK